MKKILLLSSLLILWTSYVRGQSTNIPLNRDYYHLIERYEVLNGHFIPKIHTNLKPYQRQHIAAFADSLLHDDDMNLSRVDKFNLEYMLADSWDWTEKDYGDSKKPIFKYLYRKKSDLYHVDVKDFVLHVNPVLHVGVGTESESDVTTYNNTRGVELRGIIADRLGFYTYATTTQAAFPAYVREWTSDNVVVPNEGFWKKFKDNGVDYFTARGYLSFDFIKNYLNAQFGFDRFSRGSGHRSMELSDFGPGYTFLKLNTNIWRINYTNVFAQLNADHFANAGGSLGVDNPHKFLASHHLSINITDNFNLGFFESVIIGDSTGSKFDISYLNPIIFYRALEHQGGSTENVILGMDLKWNFARHFSLYGQFILDEFLLEEIRSGDGWWANKWGGQIGLKYINAFGLKNLDLQFEHNIARPYLHAHIDVFTNYAHYRQSLGHPLGGNFREYNGFLRYQPLNRFTITGQLTYARYGADTATSNWGKDIMKSYIDREQDYNNTIGQGVDTKLFYGDLTLTYQFKHNIFVDLRTVVRKINSELPEQNRNTTWFSTSLRWNIPKTIHDF